MGKRINELRKRVKALESLVAELRRGVGGGKATKGGKGSAKKKPVAKSVKGSVKGTGKKIVRPMQKKGGVGKSAKAGVAPVLPEQATAPSSPV
jgi:hypothetical protein